MTHIELCRLAGLNKSQMSRYLGVSLVTVHHWDKERFKPSGITRALIALSLNVGRANPDVLQASIGIETPARPLQVVREFFETEGGLHYYFDVPLHRLTEWEQDPPVALCRYAALLGVAGVFLPDLAAQLRDRYPSFVEVNRSKATSKAMKQKEGAKLSRKRREGERKHLMNIQEMLEEDDNPYPW